MKRLCRRTVSASLVTLFAAVFPVLAKGPGLMPSHAGTGGTDACSDVSWLDPKKAPAFLNDVNQAKGTGDCQFHEFAAQNFFALMLDNAAGARSWPRADQVYRSSGAPNCTGVPVGGGLTTVLALNGLRKTGPVDRILEAIRGPLVDQNGRYLQFEIRLNPLLCQTVSQCQLYTQKCRDAAAVPAANFRFPAGSSKAPGVAELKIAWRVLETCNLPDSPPESKCKPDDPKQFLTISGVPVKPYSPKNEGQVEVTLALVGLHLIQKTPDHHEFIWSTWEHVSNAPVCDGSDNKTCQDPSKTSSGISTVSGWSLAHPPAEKSPPCPAKSSDTPAVPNCANFSYYTAPDVGKGIVDPKQPITQVCRIFPCGDGDQAEIASLNEAMRGKLAGTVWANYFLVGTLWSSKPPAEPLMAAGSVKLANTTMEPYIQGSRQDPRNCFSCHDAEPVAGQQIDFVHSVVRALQAGSACTVDFNTCASPAQVQTVRSSKSGRQ